MSVIDRMVSTIAEEHGVSKVKARDIIAVVFAEIETDLRENGECAIPNFGKFALTEREARTGRNPRNGEAVQIAAAAGIRFRPSAPLKARFNPLKQESRPGQPMSLRARA